MGFQLCIDIIYSKKKGVTNPRDMKSGVVSSFKRAPARKNKRESKPLPAAVK